MAGRGRAAETQTEHLEIEYLMSLEEVAKKFDVSKHTIYQWVAQGVLRAYRVPPADGDKTVPPRQRRTALLFTNQAIVDRAKVYYKIKD